MKSGVPGHRWEGEGPGPAEGGASVDREWQAGKRDRGGAAGAFVPGEEGSGSAGGAGHGLGVRSMRF